jgi:hypothetical protein
VWKTFRGKAEKCFSHCLCSFYETCILFQFWEAVAWDLQPNDLTVCARYLGHHGYWLTWTWYVRPFWNVTASMNLDRIQQLYSVLCCTLQHTHRHPRISTLDISVFSSSATPLKESTLIYLLYYCETRFTSPHYQSIRHKSTNNPSTMETCSKIGFPLV